MENRVTAGLADDQIGPLDDHDGHEERGVAGELERLAVAVGLIGERKGDKRIVVLEEEQQQRLVGLPIPGRTSRSDR